MRSRQSLGQASQTAAQSNQGKRLVRHRRIRIIIIVIIITAMAMIAVRKVFVIAVVLSAILLL